MVCSPESRSPTTHHARRTSGWSATKGYSEALPQATCTRCARRSPSPGSWRYWRGRSEPAAPHRSDCALWRAAPPNLRNRHITLDVLTDVADGIENPLEHRYLIDVERAHGLPVGTRQVLVSTGTRSDVDFLEFQLLVELDGRVWHEGIAVWGDMQRDNLHRLSSFTTLRFGWDRRRQSAIVVGLPTLIALCLLTRAVVRPPCARPPGAAATAVAVGHATGGAR